MSSEVALYLSSFMAILQRHFPPLMLHCRTKAFSHVLHLSFSFSLFLWCQCPSRFSNYCKLRSPPSPLSVLNCPLLPFLGCIITCVMSVCVVCFTYNEFPTLVTRFCYLFYLYDKSVTLVVRLLSILRIKGNGTGILHRESTFFSIQRYSMPWTVSLPGQGDVWVTEGQGTPRHALAHPRPLQHKTTNIKQHTKEKHTDIHTNQHTEKYLGTPNHTENTCKYAH